MGGPSQEGFTKLTTGVLRGLCEAKASGNETLAYAFLTRWHNDSQHPARCWTSAQLAANEIGMSSDVFRKALSSLTRKTFTEGSAEIPVITRVRSGHNGRAAVYNDNLYAARVLKDMSQVCATGPDTRGNGDPDGHPIARQPCLAINESSRKDSSAYSGRVAGMIRPSSRKDSSAHKRELLLGAASHPAKRSGAVSQPHKNSDNPTLETGGPDARAAAAALGGAAPALPTLEEYRELESRLWEDGGLESMTESEKAAYHAGHAAYAASA